MFSACRHHATTPASPCDVGLYIRIRLTALCMCVCVHVCVSMFLSLCCYYCFFSDCHIYLFSSLAARVFNKLTCYSLLVTVLLSYSVLCHRLLLFPSSLLSFLFPPRSPLPNLTLGIHGHAAGFAAIQRCLRFLV